MLHTHHGLNFDVGFFMAGEVDIGKHQDGLRAIGDVECAVEAERLHTLLFATGFVESVCEGDSLIVELVGQMRGEHGNGQGNRRLDFHAQFLGVVVGSEQAVDLGRRRHIVFFLYDAPPMELGLDAVVDTTPAVVLDVEIVRGNELPNVRAKDGADGGYDRAFGLAFVPDGENHRALRGKMTFIDRADDMLLHAEEAEVCGSFGMLHRVVPFVGPSHRQGDGKSRLDADVHVAASGSGMIDAAGVEAGGFHRDGLAVGWSPVENTVLPESERDKSAEQRAGDDGGSHNH